MDYNKSVKWLLTQTPIFQKIGAKAYKEGLGNSLLFDAHAGFPHRQFTTIHIAGTNGKGSVAHTLAAILQASGLKTGLYTSPHLVDFRERIKINGRSVTKSFVIKFIKENRAFMEPCSPSFFEVTTTMAFKWFAEKKVDVAVIETGLGGRLDCTNIITPKLSVITNIGFDHMKQLGDTLEKIATEKAGIIKPGVPVVIGEHTAGTRAVFVRKAAEVGAPVLFAQDKNRIHSKRYKDPSLVVYDAEGYPELESCLGGSCQGKNANTILAAVEELKKRGFVISEQDVRKGFKDVCRMTGLMGRWQKISEKPLMICDTGHNGHGFQYIAQQLKEIAQTSQAGKLRIVIGMAEDKNITEVLNMIPRNSICYFTRASVQRAMDSNVLKEAGAAAGLKGEAFDTVEKAVNRALADSSEKDIIFIGGSTFVVADLMATVKKTIPN